jgi:hypothetical protein
MPVVLAARIRVPWLGTAGTSGCIAFWWYFDALGLDATGEICARAQRLEQMASQAQVS